MFSENFCVYVYLFIFFIDLFFLFLCTDQETLTQPHCISDVQWQLQKQKETIHKEQ